MTGGALHPKGMDPRPKGMDPRLTGKALPVGRHLLMVTKLFLMKKRCRSVLLFFTALHMVVALPRTGFAQVERLKKVNIFSHSDTDKVLFDIVPEFNGKPLKLSDQYYLNEHGDTLYIDVFRFYITNISFTGNGNMINENSHLFDAADSNTYDFVLKKIPPGHYDGLQFTIGVDSIDNTSGANDGDLDPVNGMYWAWNSGYIMAKIEGHSKVCKTLHQAFEFHIGGYMPPNNAARPVTLKLPASFAIRRHDIPCITLKVDVATWFRGNLDLSKVNDIVTPGKEAATMADRYVKMFSVDTVEYLRCRPQ
jgi:hypothetical protein